MNLNSRGATQSNRLAMLLYILFVVAVVGMIVVYWFGRKTYPWGFLWFAGAAVIARIGYYIVRNRSKQLRKEHKSWI